MKKAKNVGGRPALPDDEKQILVPVRFPPDLLAELDAMNLARLSRPGRSALIREYVADGIAAEKKELAAEKKRRS